MSIDIKISAEIPESAKSLFILAAVFKCETPSQVLQHLDRCFMHDGSVVRSRNWIILDLKALEVHVRLVGT